MSIGSSISSRTSNLQRLQTAVARLQRTNQELFNVSEQIATRRSIIRASDDPVRASAISMLDQRLAAAGQRSQNLDRAGNALDALDSQLAGITSTLREAQSTASGQIGITSSTVERQRLAGTVDSLLQSLMNSVNADSSGVYLFGGSNATQRPIERLNGGYRYIGRGTGLLTDLGTGDRVPITLGGNNAVGETSASRQSTRDLDPAITASTRLSDLSGAAGRAIGAGNVGISFGGGPTATIDMTGAGTVQDVINRLTVGIRKYETDNSVSIMNPGGISISGSALDLNLTSATPLTITEVGGGTIAADLGLTQSALSSAASITAALNTRLTFSTPLSSLSGVTFPLGSIRIKMTQGGAVTQRVVDLSSAQTMDDVRATIERSGLGVRVQINDQNTGINVLSEVAGMNMSIEEVAGGANTASELGIRTMDTATLLSTFNGGRGVRIATGGTDPATGLPDSARDVDFRITLGTGQSFDVDLRPQDTVNVQTMLARINSQFATAVGQTPLNAAAPALTATDFAAVLTDNANGIAFTQSVGPDGITVAKQNNSAAAEDLGLIDGTYDSATSTFLAQDRSTVRVNNLFSDLIDLRDALLRDDTSGISVAGERMTVTGQRINAAAGAVASYGQRVQEAKTQLNEKNLQDTAFKSTLQDTDFTEAASRFSLLQTQLEASMRVTSQTNSRSLFDFLNL